jgi:hypothetical protein
LISLAIWNGSPAGGREAGSGADRAVHIDLTAADSADQMVVIVADTILVASR